MEKNKDPFRQRENQKGFALILLAPLTLTLVTASLGVGTALVSWSQLAQYQYQCEKLVLGFQTEHQDLLKALLGLNKKAKALTARRRALQFKLAAAAARGDGVSTLAISAEIKIVRQNQFLLEAQQKLIFAKFKSARKQLFVRSQQLFPHAKRKVPTSLPVTALGPGPAPAYQVLPQAQQLSQSQMKGDVPANVITRRSIPWQCSANLQKENEKWIAKLNKDKSLWN